mmetsp:Transcript_23429/g.93018  ORF Transcript_23429/g.93018 Transcript_23429/m.93018 type:complete len:91 (-) Transcript_23429:848-1120(-)
MHERCSSTYFTTSKGSCALVGTDTEESTIRIPPLTFLLVVETGALSELVSGAVGPVVMKNMLESVGVVSFVRESSPELETERYPLGQLKA